MFLFLRGGDSGSGGGSGSGSGSGSGNDSGSRSALPCPVLGSVSCPPLRAILPVLSCPVLSCQVLAEAGQSRRLNYSVCAVYTWVS